MSDKTKKPAAPKSRATYSKEMRSEASLTMRGLATISVTFLDGTRVEHQQPVDLDEAQFVKWCAVLLGRPDVRPGHDQDLVVTAEELEELVRRVCEERGITE